VLKRKMNMNFKWIKLSCMSLGVVALLSVLAACSSVQASGQLTPLDVNLSSSQTLKALTPIFSPYVLVIPASGTCHTGGIQVLPGATFTAEANGQSFPVQLDSTTQTATFPTLPNNTWVVVQVPAHTDLSLKDCNGYINVSGITGQMNLSANTIVASQVNLLGSSHLHVDNGSITFDGSLDSNSSDLFDANNGFISVKLPQSQPFHIDAVTNAGNISTNLGTPTPSGSSGSQLHVSSQPAPGALLTVNENAGSMNFTIV
jgi:hypothetical protein